MEEVHLFAMKRLLDVLRHTSNKMIYGETGRYPSYMIIGMKLQQMLVESSQLVWEQSKQSSEMLGVHRDNRQHKWVADVKTFLTKMPLALF